MVYQISRRAWGEYTQVELFSGSLSEMYDRCRYLQETNADGEYFGWPTAAFK